MYSKIAEKAKEEAEEAKEETKEADRIINKMKFFVQFLRDYYLEKAKQRMIVMLCSSITYMYPFFIVENVVDSSEIDIIYKSPMTYMGSLIGLTMEELDVASELLINYLRDPDSIIDKKIVRNNDGTLKEQPMTISYLYDERNEIIELFDKIINKYKIFTDPVPDLDFIPYDLFLKYISAVDTDELIEENKKEVKDAKLIEKYGSILILGKLVEDSLNLILTTEKPESYDIEDLLARRNALKADFFLIYFLKLLGIEDDISIRISYSLNKKLKIFLREPKKVDFTNILINVLPEPKPLEIYANKFLFEIPIEYIYIGSKLEKDKILIENKYIAQGLYKTTQDKKEIYLAPPNFKDKLSVANKNEFDTNFRLYINFRDFDKAKQNELYNKVKKGHCNKEDYPIHYVTNNIEDVKAVIYKHEFFCVELECPEAFEFTGSFEGLTFNIYMKDNIGKNEFDKSEIKDDEGNIIYEFKHGINALLLLITKGFEEGSIAYDEERKKEIKNKLQARKKAYFDAVKDTKL